MADVEQVKIPNIGGATDVDVIEVLVKPGDEVAAEQSIITLESDKASMEVPAPRAGIVDTIKVKVGDKVSEGDLVLTLQAKSQQDHSSSTVVEKPPAAIKEGDPASKQSESRDADKFAATTKNSDAASGQSAQQQIKVPNIGGAEKVDVIEVMVKPGDTVTADQSILTLESDKASMEVPAAADGAVLEVHVKVGDKVSEGDLVLTLSSAAQDDQPVSSTESDKTVAKSDTQIQSDSTTSSEPSTEQDAEEDEDEDDQGDVHAGPGVRRLAHEFGVDLTQVAATGQKGRVIKEDLQQFVKQRLQTSSASTGLNVAAPPSVDFAKFGDIEAKPLSKIQKISGAALHRNWVSIPHVTQFGEADITELEAFRQSQKAESDRRGVKLTPLAFLMKATVAALKAFPKFNASLDTKGENIILKKYFNIGVAVETPNGLVVPVVRDVDKKGMFALAQELAEVSAKARQTGLSLADMQGGCFSISSLGGIGGTAFTPIINAPEVAIMGVSRSYHKPVFQKDGSFKPRLMMPLSLSYDHRVIDGADAARFMVYFANCLADIRTLLL